MKPDASDDGAASSRPAGAQGQREKEDGLVEACAHPPTPRRGDINVWSARQLRAPNWEQ